MARRINYFFAIAITMLSCHSGTENKQITLQEPPPDTNTLQTLTLKPEQAAALSLKIQPLTSRTLQIQNIFQGSLYILPQHKIDYTFPTNATVIKIFVKKGDYVRKGAPLCIVQDKSIIDWQEQFLLSKEKHKHLEKEYFRLKSLYDQQAVTFKEFHNVEKEFHEAEIMLHAAANKLRLLGIHPDSLKPNTLLATFNITAKTDGILTDVLINTGQYLLPEQVLFKQIDLSEPHATLTLLEKDLNIFKPKRTLLYRTIQNQPFTLQAEMISLIPTLQPDKTLQVLCRLLPPPTNLSEGMFLQFLAKDTLTAPYAIPSSAILSIDNQNYLFKKIAPLQYQLIPIAIGLKDDKFIEIKQFLDNHTSFQDSFVVQGAFDLLHLLQNKEEE